MEEKARKVSQTKYEIKRKLAREDGMKCYYCDKPSQLQNLTLDHIYPVLGKRRLNARMRVGNLVLSCLPCNQKKGHRIISIEEFRKERMGDKYYELISTVEKTHKKNRKKYKEIAKNVVYPDQIIVKKYRNWFQRLLDLIVPI